MGALQGIRVIEMAGLAPAPYCGMILADFGADVVRVDRVGAGSMDLLARGKRSVAVDLKSAAGVDTVLRLIEKADVLLEPFRPGVMERLGLGPQIACGRNPRLVYARLTGFGQDGPYATRAGYDLLIQGMGGVMDLTGEAEREPCRVGIPVVDISTGVYSTTKPTKPFEREDPKVIQAQIDALARPAVIETPQGIGRIETYTVVHRREGPFMGIIVGRDAEDRRFAAVTPADPAVLASLEAGEQVGRPGRVSQGPDGQTNVFTPQ